MGRVRRFRSAAQHHATLGQQPVLLAGVAGTARRDDVLPRVRTATGPRHNMVEILGCTTAVLTTVAVAREHGASRQWRGRSERDANEVHEANDGRDRYRTALGTKLGPVAVHDFRLVLEHQYNGSTRGNHAERFEAGVE